MTDIFGVKARDIPHAIRIKPEDIGHGQIGAGKDGDVMVCIPLREWDQLMSAIIQYLGESEEGIDFADPYIRRHFGPGEARPAWTNFKKADKRFDKQTRQLRSDSLNRQIKASSAQPKDPA